MSIFWYLEVRSLTATQANLKTRKTSLKDPVAGCMLGMDCLTWWFRSQCSTQGVPSTGAVQFRDSDLGRVSAGKVRLLKRYKSSLLSDWFGQLCRCC